MRPLSLLLFLGVFAADVQAFELPRLTSISLVSPATVSPGEKITLRYRFASGTAPIDSVAFTLIGPSGESIGVSSDAPQGTVSFTVAPDWPNGLYALADVSATTMYDRYAVFEAGGQVVLFPRPELTAGTTPRFDSIKVTVTNAIPVYRAPVLTALTRVGSGNLTPASSPVFSFALALGTSPVTTVRLRVRDPFAATRLVSFPAGASGSASLAITNGSPNGAYTAQSLALFDASGHFVTYSRNGSWSGSPGTGTHSIDFAALDFLLGGAAVGFVDPVLKGVSLVGPTEVRIGDELKCNFVAIPGTNPISSVTFGFAQSLTEVLGVATSEASGGTATGRLPHDGPPSLKYLLQTVQLVDAQNYVTTYNRNGAVSHMTGPTTQHSLDFSALDFTSLPSQPGRLTNLAIRSNAGIGAQTLIVGFTVGGAATTGSKPLLVRGVGPALTTFGVSGVLADPMLAIYSDSVKILENDNWAGDAGLAAAAIDVGAFALAPVTSADAALIMPKAGAGSYSAQITGKNGATGVALAEVYDATPAVTFTSSTPRLVNLSARTQAGAGAETLIAGFAISGGPKTVLIRAVGPSLASFGVTGAITNPRLALFAGSKQIAASDDWSDDPALRTAFTSTGAFELPASSQDAAMVVTLPPGSYTAQVSGVNNTTGIALVEVYEVP